MPEDIDPFMAELAAAAEAAEADQQRKAKERDDRLTKEILDRSRRQIAEGQAKDAIDRQNAPFAAAAEDPQVKHLRLQREWKIEQNSRDKEAFRRKALSGTSGMNASAPVQYSKTEIVTGVYQDSKTGWFFTVDGRRISAEEAGALIASTVAHQNFVKEQTELANSKEILVPKFTTKKYMGNVQSFFINEIEQFRDIFNDADRDTTINIHKVQDNIPAGVFTNYLSRKSATNAAGDPIMGGFIHATPAQLAHLQPLLRFFMVDEQGNQDEIYFSDYTTAAYAKRIADLRAGGSIETILAPRSQRGADAGIKSFTWNYNNKHEGDYIIEASLELYFGTLAELANINYLQFLFPTGNAAELAPEINKKITSISAAEKNRALPTGNLQKTALEKLTAKIEVYQTLLSKGNSKIKTLQESQKEDIAARKKEFRQLKVVTGWSLPKGNQAELRKSFDSRGQYEAFRRGIEATSRAIFLNLYDYNVEFQQEGPTTLSLKYLGSSDNYLATGGSDIFGSNNYKDSDNVLMDQETEVSTAGFINFDGRIIDNEAGSDSEEVSRVQANGVATDPLNSLDPYLNSVPRGRNSQGENTIRVTLAGLKAAQELALSLLKAANLKKLDPNSEPITGIRRRGEYIVLLYDRARNIRLRDLYSQFLRKMIDSKAVYKARIELGDTLPAKAKIILNPAVVTAQERSSEIGRIETERQQSLPQDSTSTNTALFTPVSTLEPETDSSTLVYYMRFGDILRSAMANADLREDISLVLGNVKNKSGTEYSLYDLPITLDTFGQYFYNRVVATKLKSYPFRNFLDDMLGLVARTINQNPETAERISFDYTVVSSAKTGKGLGFKLDDDQLGDIGLGEINPLKSGGVKFHHFYNIFTRRTSHKNRKGKRRQDESEGIFHYVIGTDRGLAKNYNFSRQDTQYFQEMLIESNNAEDQIQALFLPQNVNIQMFGNGLHKNGDLLFVDSRPSLGTFAGPVLGIGGYYRVIRSSHSISNRGYETNVECVFELRVVN